MPRFFFDLTHHENDADRTGTELADAEAARVQGVVFAGEYLRDHPDLLWDGREVRTVIRDQERRIVMTIVVLAIDCG